MIGNDITWYIGEPLIEATMINKKTNEEHKVPLSIWNQNLKIKESDSLHLAPFPIEFPIPKNTRTLKQVFEFIRLLMQSKVDNYSIAIQRLDGFLIEHLKRELFIKLKQGNLTWFEILGDECSWGGNLHRTKQGVWTYNVDS